MIGMNHWRGQGQGLYDPAHEHDACGVGFIANIKGRKSHAVIRQGLKILENLTHRGAVGADPLAGDGAGILLQLPDRFLREECAAQGHRTAASREVRRRHGLPAVATARRAPLRIAAGAHHRRGRPGAARLARRADLQRWPRRERQGSSRWCARCSLPRRRLDPGGLRAQAVRDPQAGRKRRARSPTGPARALLRPSLSSRTMVYTRACCWPTRSTPSTTT
jgi:hypothetical protein